MLQTRTCACAHTHTEPGGGGGGGGGGEKRETYTHAQNYTHTASKGGGGGGVEGRDIHTCTLGFSSPLNTVSPQDEGGERPSYNYPSKNFHTFTASSDCYLVCTCSLEITQL